MLEVGDTIKKFGEMSCVFVTRQNQRDYKFFDYALWILSEGFNQDDATILTLMAKPQGFVEQLTATLPFIFRGVGVQASDPMNKVVREPLAVLAALRYPVPLAIRLIAARADDIFGLCSNSQNLSTSDQVKKFVP